MLCVCRMLFLIYSFFLWSLQCFFIFIYIQFFWWILNSCFLMGFHFYFFRLSFCNIKIFDAEIWIRIDILYRSNIATFLGVKIFFELYISQIYLISSQIIQIIIIIVIIHSLIHYVLIAPSLHLSSVWQS